MSRNVNLVFFVVSLFLVLAVFFSYPNKGSNDSNVISGFAFHPLYTGYALPYAYSTSNINTFLQFSSTIANISKSFDATDSIVYRKGFVSYDGQQWTPFILTTTNIVSGDWIYTKGTATVSFTPAQLRMSLSRNATNNTYVVIYSCSRINNAWDCHDGWQIIKFDAKITTSTTPTPTPTPSGKAIKIFIIGDSTAATYPSTLYPLTGWGMELQQFFNSQNVIVVNNAESGASSKSYLTRASWPNTNNSMSAGDYLFIQFAHNDEPGHDASVMTDPYTTYKQYLRMYIASARAKGVYPVLLTPVERNIWSGSVLTNSHGNYPDAIRELAQEQNVPLIDMTEKTRTLYISLGENYLANYFFVSGDRTHFQLRGANESANLVIKGIQELGSSSTTATLLPYIKGSTSDPPISTTGKIYYLSPSGSDSTGNGSIQRPWYSLEKAWDYLSAGDTLYMRGGSYTNYPATIYLEDKNGTSSKMIKIWNYPGEKPIIDYKNFIATSEENVFRLHNINYVHFKGIRITNLVQTRDVVLRGMILYNDVSNCIFEQMETDHIGGWGVTIADNCNNNLFLNFDSHHNSDPYSPDSYGGADGFQTGSLTSTNNIFRGCRSWSNSDDGWDFRMASGLYIIENSWAFWNGYQEDGVTQGGNGEGLKLGTHTTTKETRRVVKNSLIFENRWTGIGSAPDGYNSVGGVEIYNTVVYKNGEGMNFDYGLPSILRNNIAYGNGGNNDNFRDGSNTVHDHNSFDLPITITGSDFLSLNSSCMDDSRKLDGSLPDCNFLKPSSSSKVIGAGINVGLSTDGAGKSWKTNPSMGAYEYYP